MIFETYSEKETYELGYKIGQECKPGQVYTLIGDLGVGKTVFVKGVAEGIGTKEYINSPTFTIVQVYDDGRLPLYHFDVYRIEDEDEMYEVGFDDYLYGEGVCLIEWADLVKGLIPKAHTRIEIKKDLDKGFNYRSISIEEYK